MLSACETALGEQVPGAALTTLAAAFSQAGAQSVVASLWKVNDETTRHFMVAFHRALATSGRAAALQQAQLTVLRTQVTAHPFYWAPFILIGARQPAPRSLGSVNVKVDPAPIRLVTQSRPPCSSTNFRESASPSPVPSTFFAALPTCRNSSNTAS